MAMAIVSIISVVGIVAVILMVARHLISGAVAVLTGIVIVAVLIGFYFAMRQRSRQDAYVTSSGGFWQDLSDGFMTTVRDVFSALFGVF